MATLETWVGEVASMEASSGRDLKFPGDYALYAEYGQAFTPPASIDDNEARMAEYGVEPGDLKDCHVNSGQVVVFDDATSLWYVEGVAYGSSMIPVEHAWLVTGSGQVVDPTWGQRDAQITESYRLADDVPTDAEPGVEYFGVPFATKAVSASAMDNEVWGMIGYWNPDFYREGIPAKSLARIISTDLTSVSIRDTIQVSGE